MLRWRMCELFIWSAAPSDIRDSLSHTDSDLEIPQNCQRLLTITIIIFTGQQLWTNEPIDHVHILFSFQETQNLFLSYIHQVLSCL